MKQIKIILFLLLVLMAGCQTKPLDHIPQEAIPDEAESLSRDVQIQLTRAYPNLSFTRPLEYRTAGDGEENFFVVEKAGKIMMFANAPDVDSAEVFLDITNVVDSSASEKGLLGLAFHPDYKNNGLFYVNYTTQNSTVIARYQTESNHPNRAVASSGEIILSFPQPYNNHNGGQIEFGPDGYLYIATGDGGLGGDPQNNAQNLGNLLGKILRIDVDHPDTEIAYGIPNDNPFAQNMQGYREEIYAYGLRNPWKFSFDLQRGWLWAADVGQDKVEEINLIEKGGNYGWNRMEGSVGYLQPEQHVGDDLILPVWEYNHPVGNSITGGYVYYGSGIPALNGAYVYGDFGTGAIWALWLDDDLRPENRLLLETDLRISSFGVDGDNELYVVDYRGEIYKITQF